MMRPNQPNLALEVEPFRPTSVEKGYVQIDQKWSHDIAHSLVIIFHTDVCMYTQFSSLTSSIHVSWCAKKYNQTNPQYQHVVAAVA